MTTTLMYARAALRLSAEDRANLDALSASLTDDVRRPRVSLSETIRAALRIAAGTLTAASAAGGC